MTAVAATVEAPAKLTLELRVTGVRSDGYHLIDAEMTTLSISDRLTITPAADRPAGITVTGPFADGVPVGADNLIARALAACGERADVVVDKQIPNGGGLGGGSADAAAVLRWAGHPTDAAGLAAAARIGADVAFCLVGGRARVRGIGEIVEPIPSAPQVVTLVVPPIHVSTPAVYRAWDDLGGPTSDGPNDLEPAAVAVEPELARWRDRVRDLAGVRPILAGSGATWFVHGAREDALAALGDEGASVIVTTTG